MTEEPGPYEPYQPPSAGQSPYGQPPYGQPQYGQPPAWSPQPAPPGYYGYYGHPSVGPQPASGMYVAAAVINWVVLALVVLGTCGFGLIAAAWFVPMTIFIHKGATDRYKHTALGVCTLLFCNVISGILMLVEDSNRQPPPLR